MKAEAYIDGSFNAATKVYGSGVLLFIEGKEEPICLSQPGNNPAFVSQRNVAGEVMAAMLVMEGCKKIPNLEELTIYYDYAGLECWVKGTWNARNSLSQAYRDYARSLPFKLSFRKVTAHTGVRYNEEADRLAKMACRLLK